MPLQARTASQIFFALTMMGVGLIGLIDRNFAAVWVGVPQTFPGRELLVYLCAIVALATGGAMLVKRISAPAALVLLAYLAAWTAAFKGQFIVRAPLEEGAYQSVGENAVLIAAAWTIYAATAGDRFPRFGFLIGDRGTRAAHVLYGLGLVAFGLSHFFYLELTAPLVPTWLPQPVFWAYFTGGIYLVTGLAIIADVGAAMAAIAAAVQIALISLLVWGPMVLSGELTPMHKQETIESWALTAGAAVLSFSFGPVRARLGSIGRRRAPSGAAGA